MKMAGDILSTILRTLSSQGVVINRGHLLALRTSYLRLAQDAVRQYHADSLMNSLEYDRHGEEQAVEGFARQITAAGEQVFDAGSTELALPNWARVIAAAPDICHHLRQVAEDDEREFG